MSSPILHGNKQQGIAHLRTQLERDYLKARKKEFARKQPGQQLLINPTSKVLRKSISVV